MIRFFRVTPPSVHQMMLSLERAGLISRDPGAPEALPSCSNAPSCPSYSRDTLNQSKPL